LYQPPQSQCGLFQGLAAAGLEPSLLLNHDGHFGDFLKDVQQSGGLNIAPLGPLGAAVHQRSFDDTPIYDDYDLLNRWWQKRQSQPAAPQALYYNTISLHDGNRLAGGKAVTNSLETFRPRVDKLLGDLDRFVTELEKSGRQAVVVFVPEHGAAIRGDAIQISGMREIPSPQITLVPVGVKFVGMKQPPASPLQITQPSSYLALSELLSRSVNQDPYALPSVDLAGYVKDLPITEFVAENEETAIVRTRAGYSMRTPDGAWMDFVQGK
ncbi:cellulose biosynthesis protein BcsG, partial [Methylogaea oryzae]